jgi:formiminotetrahydrofolate cyclodeaminase
MLVDKSVRDLLAAFSSSDPTPGGGSAAALSSAVGASLLLMVAGLPKTHSGTEADREALQQASHALAGLRQKLTDAIDADAQAYEHVVAAYKLPKQTPAEQQARKKAIQAALKAATDVPLSVMRLSSQALAQGVAVATHGNRSAASDVGVGALLLRSGAGGAFLNIETNLGGVGDDDYQNAVGAEAATLTEAIDRARAKIEQALGLT